LAMEAVILSAEA